MPSRSTSQRVFVACAAGLAVVLSVTVAGCSAGDVELNGKVFDAVGATGLLGKPSGKVKMAERQALVVPPSMDRLPAPGSGMPADADVTRQVVDPERAKVISAAELARRQEEFCKANYELPKMRGENVDAVAGPAGSCRKSAFEAFSKWNKGDAEPAPEQTVEQAASTPGTTTGSIGTVSEAAPPRATSRR